MYTCSIVILLDNPNVLTGSGAHVYLRQTPPPPLHSPEDSTTVMVFEYVDMLLRSIVESYCQFQQIRRQGFENSGRVSADRAREQPSKGEGRLGRPQARSFCQTQRYPAKASLHGVLRRVLLAQASDLLNKAHCQKVTIPFQHETDQSLSIGVYG